MSDDNKLAAGILNPKLVKIFEDAGAVQTHPKPFDHCDDCNWPESCYRAGFCVQHTEPEAKMAEISGQVPEVLRLMAAYIEREEVLRGINPEFLRVQARIIEDQRPTPEQEPVGYVEEDELPVTGRATLHQKPNPSRVPLYGCQDNG